MTYCETYFSKSLRELVYDDIEKFFKTERQENETLEFKSGRGEFDSVLTKNIIKGISAFLNSSGGVLIWGAPVEKAIDKEKGKICVGDLSPLATFVEKDRLINRILSAISYMPTGVNVSTLEKDSRYVYVFEVAESKSKPHQYNGSYYIRLDGQSKPSPHYLVDALFKQIKAPDLSSQIEASVREHIDGRNLEIDLKVVIFNNSNAINAKSVGYHIRIDLGQFKSNNLKTDSYQSLSIVPKWLGVTMTHKVLLSRMHLEYRLKVSIQFFSENSPLKHSYYEISIDKIYLEPRVIAIVENELADEVFESIQNEKASMRSDDGQ